MENDSSDDNGNRSYMACSCAAYLRPLLRYRVWVCLFCVNKRRENVMCSALEPAYFVPETVKADVLFQNMKQTHTTFTLRSPS